MNIGGSRGAIDTTEKYGGDGDDGGFVAMRRLSTFCVLLSSRVLSFCDGFCSHFPRVWTDERAGAAPGGRTEYLVLAQGRHPGPAERESE